MENGIFRSSAQNSVARGKLWALVLTITVVTKLLCCRLNKLRMRSGDSECSADGGVGGTPRSPVDPRSISLVERAESTADNQTDEQADNSNLQMTRQMSVS